MASQYPLPQGTSTCQPGSYLEPPEALPQAWTDPSLGHHSPYCSPTEE